MGEEGSGLVESGAKKKVGEGGREMIDLLVEPLAKDNMCDRGGSRENIVDGVVEETVESVLKHNK